MRMGLTRGRRLAAVALLVVLLLFTLTTSIVVADLVGVGWGWSLFAAGGGRAASSSYSMRSTIGQPVTASSFGSTYGVCSGVWCKTSNVCRVYLPLVVR